MLGIHKLKTLVIQNMSIMGESRDMSRIYCRVLARRGLQRTARAATRHGARDPLVRPQVDQKPPRQKLKKARMAYLIRLIFTKTG